MVNLILNSTFAYRKYKKNTNHENKVIFINNLTTIPDAVDEKSIYEIKDVKYQGLTKQIKAEMDAANRTGKKFKLIVRKDTELSIDIKTFLEENKAELLFIEDILGLPPHK